jgi:tryptophan 7-halogenase
MAHAAGGLVSAVQELVIVGRDAPVWLSACVMQYALGPAGVRITVVELPPRTTPADLCISLPALEALHGRLRIDESRLVAATRGAFTLGRRFLDASGHAPAFFHAHGSNGTRIDKKEFLPQWLKARREGPVVPFEAFSLTAAAARQGRMLLPDVAVESFGFTDYGYHLPAIPYGAWLRQLATRRGVRGLAARHLEVRVDEARGISELLLDGGRPVTGDFFLDVTGAEGALTRALGVGRDSWRTDFPVDRVLYACSELKSPLPIYSEVRADSGGWTALAASQLCVHVQQAYCSELLPEAIALDNAARMGLKQVVIRARDPGRRVRAWEKNCVAIGEAACVFDPVHFLDLHSVQVGLVHLLHLFPVQAEYGVERDEYNQNVRSAFERMRDFQSAHYLLNGYGLNRPDGDFWSRARAVPVSAELAHKIDAFRARGEAVHYEDEAFTIDDWQALFLGHGLVPETHDPAVERTPSDLRDAELARIQDFIRRKVDDQRSHAAYLHSVCAPRAAGAGGATPH